MSNITFKLLRSLVIPAFGRPNKGKIVFSADEFGLSYEVSPFPADKLIKVNIFVTELSSGWKLSLKELSITEAGFPSGVILNQSEIDSYNSNYSRLTELSAKLSEEAAIEAVEVKIGEPTPKMDQLIEANKELASLVQPTPNELYINKYDEMIQYFNADGTLTDAGIEISKEIGFFGGKIRDYIG